MPRPAVIQLMSPGPDRLQRPEAVALFRYTLRVLSDPSKRNALWLGFWAGWLFNSKYVFALAIAGAALLIAWTLRKRRARARARRRVGGGHRRCRCSCSRSSTTTCAGARSRRPATSRTSLRTSAAACSTVRGACSRRRTRARCSTRRRSCSRCSAGPRAIREHRRLGLALLVLVVPTFLVYCTYRIVERRLRVGPAVLRVGRAGAARRHRVVRRRTIVARGAKRVRRAASSRAGIGVQLLGSALYWDHFIRIAIDVKNQWLGNPNRSGAYIPERGRGHCDSCFEDTYEILWTPAFQPIAGHWWLVKSLARGDDDGAARRSTRRGAATRRSQMNLGGDVSARADRLVGPAVAQGRDRTRWLVGLGPAARCSPPGRRVRDLEVDSPPPIRYLWPHDAEGRAEPA